MNHSSGMAYRICVLFALLLISPQSVFARSILGQNADYEFDLSHRRVPPTPYELWVSGCEDANACTFDYLEYAPTSPAIDDTEQSSTDTHAAVTHTRVCHHQTIPPPCQPLLQHLRKTTDPRVISSFESRHMGEGDLDLIFLVNTAGDPEIIKHRLYNFYLNLMEHNFPLPPITPLTTSPRWRNESTATEEFVRSSKYLLSDHAAAIERRPFVSVILYNQTHSTVFHSISGCLVCLADRIKYELFDAIRQMDSFHILDEQIMKKEKADGGNDGSSTITSLPSSKLSLTPVPIYRTLTNYIETAQKQRARKPSQKKKNNKKYVLVHRPYAHQHLIVLDGIGYLPATGADIHLRSQHMPSEEEVTQHNNAFAAFVTLITSPPISTQHALSIALFYDSEYQSYYNATLGSPAHASIYTYDSSHFNAAFTFKNLIADKVKRKITINEERRVLPYATSSSTTSAHTDFTLPSQDSSLQAQLLSRQLMLRTYDVNRLEITFNGQLKHVWEENYRHTNAMRKWCNPCQLLRSCDQLNGYLPYTAEWADHYDWIKLIRIPPYRAHQVCSILHGDTELLPKGTIQQNKALLNVTEVTGINIQEISDGSEQQVDSHAADTKMKDDTLIEVPITATDQPADMSESTENYASLPSYSELPAATSADITTTLGAPFPLFRTRPYHHGSNRWSRDNLFGQYRRESIINAQRMQSVAADAVAREIASAELAAASADTAAADAAAAASAAQDAEAHPSSEAEIDYLRQMVQYTQAEADEARMKADVMKGVPDILKGHAEDITSWAAGYNHITTPLMQTDWMSKAVEFVATAAQMTRDAHGQVDVTLVGTADKYEARNLHIRNAQATAYAADVLEQTVRAAATRAAAAVASAVAAFTPPIRPHRSVQVIEWDPSLPFTSEIIAGGRPVILRNTIVTQWDALKKWNSAYLRKKFKKHKQKLMKTKISKPSPKIDSASSTYEKDGLASESYRSDSRKFFDPDDRTPLSIPLLLNLTMTYEEKDCDIDEVMDAITEHETIKFGYEIEEEIDSSKKKKIDVVPPPNAPLSPSTNPLYYYFADIPPWLQRDVKPYYQLFDTEHDITLNKMFMWFSSAQVNMHSHFDQDHNFFVQIAGVKRFTLVMPEQWENMNLYPRIHPLWHKSQVDYNQPDLSLYSNYYRAEAYMAEVHPGDVLYIPPYTWHQVETVTPSISLSVWSHDTQTVKLMESIYRHDHKFDLLEDPIGRRYALRLYLDLIIYDLYGVNQTTKFMQKVVRKRYAPLVNLFREEAETDAPTSKSLKDSPARQEPLCPADKIPTAQHVSPFLYFTPRAYICTAFIHL